MTIEKLNKTDECRHLLEAPAPEVVGELIEELRRLRKVLALASEYILGVNADHPRGMDDDRDELLDRIDEALLK